MSTPKINICKACQQEISDLKFGYCSVCREDMEKADLQLAIRNHIPKDWRIGQLFTNFLRWLAQKGYAPIHLGLTMGMADPFHLSDEEIIKYWFEFIERDKEKENWQILWEKGICPNCQDNRKECKGESNVHVAPDKNGNLPDFVCLRCGYNYKIGR